MSTNPTRLASNLSAAVVAGIAAWSSYHHMVSVALSVGERPDVAYVLPLSVDGMLVVASVAMVDDRRSGRKVRWSARLAFVAGVTASVGANVAAAQPTVGARIVAAWPAVALLLTVELLSRTGRLLRQPAPEPVQEAVAPVAPVSPVAPLPAGDISWPTAEQLPVPMSPAVPRSYLDDVNPPLRAPEPVSASAPVSPALPSKTRMAVAQALAPAGPTAVRAAADREARRTARAAQSTGATRTTARVSAARPRRAAEDDVTSG